MHGFKLWGEAAISGEKAEMPGESMPYIARSIHLFAFMHR